MPHPANDPLRISDAGLALIERFEGFRSDWYLDPVGVRTIAFGWTGPLPNGLVPPLTEAEGRRLLRDTVGDYEAAVRRLVAVPLGQPQFDALVSFTYNLGASNLSSSTLLRLLNEGRVREAAAEFDKWVLAGGVPLAGLVRRRAAERALFESAPSPTPPVPSPPDPPPIAPDPAPHRPVPITEVDPLPARPPHGLETDLPDPPPVPDPPRPDVGPDPRDDDATDPPPSPGRSGW
jgi:GH24 family phage-related lysozyme (muramidase)